MNNKLTADWLALCEPHLGWVALAAVVIAVLLLFVANALTGWRKQAVKLLILPPCLLFWAIIGYRLSMKL